MSRSHWNSPSSPATPQQPRRSQRTAAPLTLDAFVSRIYLPHVRNRKRSWQVDERIARQHLSPAFGERPLAAISRSDVETWLQALAARGLGPATRNRILSVLKSICALAAVHGLLPPGGSPCAAVPSFKIHALRERYLSRTEARSLMAALEQSDRQEARALRLLLLTGARKSEILRLRWDDVRLDVRLLTVPLSKSNRPRHIPLSEEAAAVIRSIPRLPGNPWLFPGHAPGKPLSDIYRYWNTLRRSLGLPDVRIHDLRHTFASFLVNAGHSLYEVQKLLGHSDPRTTMRYAHLGPSPLLVAAETVSDLLAPRPAGNPALPDSAERQNADGRPRRRLRTLSRERRKKRKCINQIHGRMPSTRQGRIDRCTVDECR